MNLQMIDLLEKIAVPSPEYDLQLLRQAGFISEAGLPNLAIINFEVACISRPLMDRIKSCHLNLSEICHHLNSLCSKRAEQEIHLFLLCLMESLDFPIPFMYMQLPAANQVLSAYLSELLKDFFDI